MDLNLGDTRLIIDACKGRGLSLNAAAYVLATPYWETGRMMKPIYEKGARAYFNKYEPGTKIGANLGNTQKGDGYLYRGRGFVQLTGRANYAKAGKKLGVDLIGKPDLALDSAVAPLILLTGMIEGWFTGKKLSDYITATKADFVGARRIINGQDKAKEIAALAKQYVGLLQADGYTGARTPLKIAPTPPALVPVAPPTISNEIPKASGPTVGEVKPAVPDKKPLAAGGIVLLLTGIATFWHHITTFFGSIF